MSKEQTEAKTIYLQSIEAGALAGMMKAAQYESNRPLWESDPDFLNPYKDLPPLQSWATIGERQALPKEGIITFSAKQKKGKSLSTYALAIPLLSGNAFDTLTPTDRPNLIMCFDMEMSETTLTNRALSQVQTIGEYGTRFVVCPLKAKSIEQRLATIKEKTERYNPAIVIIDQAAKLVTNGNDIAESNAITDLLDKLSIGRSVWAVMHENKGQDDTNMKGHLGSFLSYAAVEAYGVDRKDGIFTITLKEARDSDAENATPIHFAIDVNGHIISAADIVKAESDKRAEGWRSHMERIFGNDLTLQRCEIINRVKAENSGIDAENVFDNAAKCGAIHKIGNGKRDPYELTPKTQPI